MFRGSGSVTAAAMGLVAVLIALPAAAQPPAGVAPPLPPADTLRIVTPVPPSATVADLSREFERLLGIWQPVRASQLGLTRGDGDLGPSSREETDRAAAAWRALEARIDSVGARPLSRDDRLDLALMRHDIRRTRFEQDSLRVWEEDPTWGIDQVAWGILGLAGREGTPLRQRALALMQRETQIPAFLDDALARLERVDAVRADRALEQAETVRRFIEYRGPILGSQLNDPVLALELHSAGRDALVALNRFREGLNARLAAGADSTWVLGPERLTGYLAASEEIRATVPELVAVAENEIAWLESRLTRVAHDIDSTATVAGVLDELADDHPSERDVLVEVELALGEVYDFSRDGGFLDIPPGPPIRVAASPASARWANASLAVPGPFEASDRAPVFYVTVPSRNDTPGDRLEVLRFLNHSFLLSLVAHEAYPGHFVQSRYLSRNPRRIRRIVTSQAFVEGWAHYAESLLAEAGFHPGDRRYRAALLQSALRRAGRFRIAVGLHAEGWTREDAERYLIERCYVEPVVARREAARGVLDPLYLTYTLGRLWIEDLREAVHARDGAAFDPVEFHTRLLSLGAPPLPYARAMLLGEDLPTALHAD